MFVVASSGARRVAARPSALCTKRAETVVNGVRVELFASHGVGHPIAADRLLDVCLPSPFDSHLYEGEVALATEPPVASVADLCALLATRDDDTVVDTSVRKNDCFTTLAMPSSFEALEDLNEVSDDEVDDDDEYDQESAEEEPPLSDHDLADDDLADELRE